MPVKSTYRHYNLNEPTKRTFEVNQFKGVDYTPGQLNIDDYHAVEISNIVYKDKVNQKRNGWEQVGKVGNLSYYYENKESGIITERKNSTNINGVWVFKLNGKDCCIAHVGKILYIVTGFGKNKSFLESKFTPLTYKVTRNGHDYNNVVSIELNDARSSAFYGSKRLYILDGKNYLVLNLEKNILSYVEDNEETYIPTTTVGITYKESSVNNLAPLDDVNLLTQYRKNKLISGTFIPSETTPVAPLLWDYELDTSVNPKRPQDINNISISIQSLNGESD